MVQISRVSVKYTSFFNKPLLKFKYQWCAKMKVVNPETVSIAHASLIPPLPPPPPPKKKELLNQLLLTLLVKMVLSSHRSKEKKCCTCML